MGNNPVMVGVGYPTPAIPANPPPNANGWHQVGAAGEPAFQNSWVAFSTGYEVMFRVVGGFLIIRGAVKNGSSASAVIFTLPPAYRPSISSWDNVVPSLDASGSSSVTVGNDGNVLIFARGSTTYTELNVIVPL